jgi:hypothetical protein
MTITINPVFTTVRFIMSVTYTDIQVYDMETVKIQKSGNGLIVGIPASVARMLNIEKGQVYKLTIESLGKNHKLIYAPIE